jgi:hypothetical protein
MDGVEQGEQFLILGRYDFLQVDGSDLTVEIGNFFRHESDGLKMVH